MKLEELARQSSAAARASVARLEVPSMGDTTPNRSWKPIMAGVAVTALVVGGLAVLARDRSDDASADTYLPSVAEVPRLGLELDEWSVSFAGSFEDLSTGEGRAVIDYYGDAAGDPYAAGDLLIATNTGADPSSRAPEAPEPETVGLRGTLATVSTSTDLGLPTDATSISWYETDSDGTTDEIILVSRSFDLDRLIAIAEALTIDGGHVTPGENLGLDRLASATGTPFEALARSGDGYVVGYMNPASSDFVVISSWRGNLLQETNAMRWWAADVTAVEVDGRPGYLARFDESLAYLGPMLSWAPVDGVVTTLSHFGEDEPLDPVALAETAYEIDDATWAEFLVATEEARTDTAEFDVIFGQGAGTLGDTEYSWVLGLQGSSLCFDLQTTSEGTVSCQDRAGIDAPAGGARTVDNGFGPTLAQVVIAADPDVEEISETQGSYELTRVEAGGVSWFVAIGDASVQPSFDVIIDGAIVATLGAAVEAIAEFDPSPEADPDAVELGIADTTVVTTGDDRSALS